MFSQVHQCKHNAKTEEGPKYDARNPPPMYTIVWYITSRRVDPTSIGQHGGLKVVEDEVAFRVVRDCVIAV